MDIYKAERVDHDIPLDHFDYHYVTKCSDIKELEKMLKVLRSGSLGAYPDLQQFIEQKLTSLAPKSRVLRKSERLKNVKDLDYEEAREILGDMENWTSQIKTVEESLKSTPSERGDTNLPPVRGVTEQIPVQQGKEAPKNEKKNKKVTPRSYKEWDRIDVDAELAKVDKEEVQIKENKNSLRKSKKPKISTIVDTTGLTDEEKEKVAEREKNKGNEAFRSSDYKEALQYYNRSISVVPSVPAINNRAQTYVKLKKWDEAIRDCCTVLQEDQDNIKALLRRVVGLQGKKEYKKAKTDLDHVLRLEPNNKRAQDLLVEVDGALAEQKKKGRRMVIEDEEGNDSESDEKQDAEKQGQEKFGKPETQSVEPSISEVLNISKKSGKVLIEEMPDSVEDVKSKDSKDKKSKQEMKDNKKESKKENDESKKAPQREAASKTAPEETEKIVYSKLKQESGLDQLEAKVQEAREEKLRMEQRIAQSKKQVQEAQAELQRKKAELETVEKSIDDSLKTAAGIVESKTEAPEQKLCAPIPPALLKVKDKAKDLFTRGQYGEAASKYSDIIDKLMKDPEQHENLAVIYSNRAACFSKIGDSKKCVEDCTAALDITPGALKPLIRRAQALEAMERYDKAYMDYSQVTYIDSSIDSVMQGKNRCQRTLGELHGPKWRERLPAAQPITRGLSSAQPIRRQDTSGDAQSKNSSQSDPANHKEESNASKSPGNVEKEFEKLNNEGRKCVQSQDFEKAAEFYSQCIRLCPHKTVAYTNRALCYIRLQKPANVIEDCDSAMKWEPENIKALFRRAQAFKNLENYENSEADLKKLLQLDPKNSSARQELLQVNTLIQNKKNAAPQKSETSQKDEKSQKPEKKQKKIGILEVDDDSDDESEQLDTLSAVDQKITPESQNNEKTSASHESRSTQENKEKDLKRQRTADADTTEIPSEVEESSTKDSSREKSEQNEKESEEIALNMKTLDSEDLKSSSSGPGKLKTAYEFIQAWTSLKRCSDTQPYAKLIEQIEPQDLPKVVSNKLDSNMLKMVIKCIEVFIDKGQLSQSLAYLQHLPSVPRFQVITMFMSEQEKDDLGYLLTKLEELGHCKYLTEDLRKLRKIYGLE